MVISKPYLYKVLHLRFWRLLHPANIRYLCLKHRTCLQGSFPITKAVERSVINPARKIRREGNFPRALLSMNKQGCLWCAVFSKKRWTVSLTIPMQNFLAEAYRGLPARLAAFVRKHWSIPSKIYIGNCVVCNIQCIQPTDGLLNQMRETWSKSSV